MFVLHGIVRGLTQSEATDPGEQAIDTREFEFMVGEKRLCGSFPVVGFKDRDKIAAVVTEYDNGALYAHAVFRQRDGMLWTRSYAGKGRLVLFWDYWRLMTVAVLVLLLLFSPVFYFIPVPGAGFWGSALPVGALIYATCAAMVICGCVTSYGGKYAEQVLRQLGFKRPAMVNLSPFSEHALSAGSEKQSGSEHVYDLVAALKKYDCLPAWHPERT